MCVDLTRIVKTSGKLHRHGTQSAVNRVTIGSVSLRCYSATVRSLSSVRHDALRARPLRGGLQLKCACCGRFCTLPRRRDAETRLLCVGHSRDVGKLLGSAPPQRAEGFKLSRGGLVIRLAFAFASKRVACTEVDSANTTHVVRVQVPDRGGRPNESRPQPEMPRFRQVAKYPRAAPPSRAQRPK